MSTRTKIVFIALGFALAFWIFDAALDAYLFNHYRFLDIFIINVPLHEIYIRLIVLLLSIIFAYILSNQFLKRDHTLKHLKNLNSILSAIKSVNIVISEHKDDIALVDEICKVLYRERKYNSVWCSLFENGQLRHLMTIGLEEKEREKVESWFYNNNKPDYIDSVLNDSKRICCVSNDKIVKTNNLEEFDKNSNSILARIETTEKVYGILSVSLNAAFLSAENEVTFLSEVADGIGNTLKKMELNDLRSQTEKTLAENEIRFRELFDNMDNGVAVYEAVNEGQDFIFLDFNKKAEQIEKVDKKNLLGKAVTEVFPGVKEFGIFDVFKKVWQTGNPEHFPTSFYKDDRIVGWRENYIYKLPSGEIVAIYNDKTEQKRLEQDLEFNQELLNETARMAKVGGWEHDFITRKAIWTKELYHIIGLEEGTEPPGMDEHLNYYPPEEREILQHAFEMSIKNKKPFDLELRVNTAKGQQIWARAIGYPVFINEQCVKFKGTFQDITDQKMAEFALIESEAKYRRLTENAQDMIYRMSLVTGEYEYISPASTEMCGYTPQEFYQSSMLIQKFIHPDWRDYFKKEWEKLLRGEISPIYEYQIIHKSGMEKWFYQRNVLVRDEQGKPIAIEGIVTDITERKIVEKRIHDLNDELEKRVEERTDQLKEANKELEAFTYSVSHDLRAPLRAIDGFSKIIEEEYSKILDSEGKRLFGIIRSNTKKMDHLITDLLHLSRVSRGELTFSNIDMAQMAESIFKEISSEQVKNQFTFNVASLPVIQADSRLVKQVWLNLLDNAIKYTLPAPEKVITVNGYCDNGMNVFSVSDTGVGFDDLYIHKLFGVFQRLHKEQEFPGTGVGLAIVERIIQRHNGKVWAESKKNKGSTFYFSIPNMEENDGD